MAILEVVAATNPLKIAEEFTWLTPSMIVII